MKSSISDLHLKVSEEMQRLFCKKSRFENILNKLPKEGKFKVLVLDTSNGKIVIDEDIS